MKTIGKKSLTGTAVFFLFAASFAQQAEAKRSLSTPMLKKGNKQQEATKSSSRSNQSPNSSSFRGSEDKKTSTAERKSALEAHGVSFAPIDIERIKRAVPPPRPHDNNNKKNAESFAPKSIVDPLDTRVRVYPDTFPARAVVTILFGDGYMCSGALIDSNLVLTAGHCIHDGITPGDDGFYDPTTYTIIPGADGEGNQPYGTCGATWTDTVVGWANFGYDEYDYGVISLDCSIGDTVGWFGFFSRGQKNHQPAIISGYPGDKAGDQWWSSNNVAKKTGRKLFYRNDTYDGMSGSPIWFDKEPSPQEGCSTGGPCIAGVHGYGTDEKNHNKWYRDYNSGVIINDAVYNNLLFWKTMDTPFPGSK